MTVFRIIFVFSCCCLVRKNKTLCAHCFAEIFLSWCLCVRALNPAAERREAGRDKRDWNEDEANQRSTEKEPKAITKRMRDLCRAATFNMHNRHHMCRNNTDRYSCSIGFGRWSAHAWNGGGHTFNGRLHGKSFARAHKIQITTLFSCRLTRLRAHGAP